MASDQNLELMLDFYLSTLFSLEKWLALPLAEKNNHTLSNCVGCYEKHKEQQHFFPLKPFYEPKPVVVLDQRALQRQGPENFTSNAVTELNRVYTNQASTAFLESLLKVKSTGLERKKTAKERRKERRDMQKEITKKVNEHFAQNAAITLLTKENPDISTTIKGWYSLSIRHHSQKGLSHMLPISIMYLGTQKN